jgi:hypothetical protein
MFHPQSRIVHRRMHATFFTVAVTDSTKCAPIFHATYRPSLACWLQAFSLLLGLPCMHVY